MTGFGKAEVSLPDKKVTIELKSLNSKNTDISFKLPYIYRGNEADIRKLLIEKLERGKIDLNLIIEYNDGASYAVINEQVVKSLYMKLKALSDELGIAQEEPLLSAILRLPEAVKTDKREPDDQEWKLIIAGLLTAIEDLNNFRLQEGEALEKDIVKRIKFIVENLDKVNQFEKQRIEKIREKFRNGLSDLKLTEESDKNRFEQEIIYFLEKMDITEEKTRLRNHCSFFLDTLALPEANGKKLGFISQEIGREINTLGSKASDSDIQKLVVEMKDDLEKIKEQLLNIL